MLPDVVTCVAETAREAQSQSKELRSQIQDLHAIRIQLETDRDGLNAEVNDLRGVLNDAQSRIDSVNETLNQLKADSERRLRDKDDELNAIRYFSHSTSSHSIFTAHSNLIIHLVLHLIFIAALS